MKKNVWFAALFLMVVLLALFFWEAPRNWILTLLSDTYLFIKANIIAILTAFFLVKGKFVIQLFLRKIILLSATGLGKRYMIERVLNHEIKVHFLDHMKGDFKKLITHIKVNFRNFPLVKKIMTGFAFLGSLGFVGKFMGGMLALKVFIAKIWSFLLAIFLKLLSGFFYFVTKIFWGSWLAPILEVVLFSSFLEWLEKVPFLKAGFHAIYQFFAYFFGWIEKLIAKLMKRPLRRFLKWMVKTMKIAIYKFIGYERVSRYTRFQEERKRHLNAFEKIKEDRHSRSYKKMHLSSWQRLKKKREQYKTLSKTGVQ